MVITLSKLKRLFSRVASLEAAAPTVTPKVWLGILTQTGNSAPVASVIINDFGSEFEWQRDELGAYYVNIPGAFPEGKTVVTIISTRDDVFSTIYHDFGPPDYVAIRTSRYNAGSVADEDDLLINTPVKIEVYP